MTMNLDKIIDDVARGSNISINSQKSHSFQDSQSTHVKILKTQVLSQNNTCLENPNTLPNTYLYSRLSLIRIDLDASILNTD
jgi:hypothetical protein